MPAAASARIADSRPDPGPLTRTSTVRTPWSRAMFAALAAACCAANGVPLRDPRKPSEPELFHDTVPQSAVHKYLPALMDAQREVHSMRIVVVRSGTRVHARARESVLKVVV